MLLCLWLMLLGICLTVWLCLGGVFASVCYDVCCRLFGEFSWGCAAGCGLQWVCWLLDLLCCGLVFSW